MSDFSLNNLNQANIQGNFMKLHSETDIYKFANVVNAALEKFKASQDAELMLILLETLTKIQFSSSSDYVYIHFFDAFNFLVATANTKRCLSVYCEFLAKQRHPCEKSFNKILEGAIKEGFLEEVSSALDDLLVLNKLSSNAVKEIFSNLKIMNRCDFASKIILEIPIENPSIAYIWDLYIGNFFKGNERVVKNTLKTLAKLNVPEKTAQIQNIYSGFFDFLLKNNEESEFIFEVLYDVIEMDLKISGQNLRNFWMKCFEENFEFEQLFINLKNCVSLLDSYSVGLIFKKLIQRNQKLETLTVLDFFINNNFPNIKFGEINLSAAEFKYIILLQNQVSIFKDQKSKEGEIISQADILENSDFSILDSFSVENFGQK